ncbi:MAG: hypothetical protein BRD26_05570 [Bacteroidetes bacterium QH_1_64_81]|nr:MAG: hypothetical protein BRD26_05570 [Bacteroidetes bacterium QH_1_64_81]
MLLVGVLLTATTALAQGPTPLTTIEDAGGDVVLESYDDGALLAPYVSSGAGAIPATGRGTRMMWYPGKGAFRAGYVSGSQWDDSNIGSWSVAFGVNTTASGDGSTAMGSNTTAFGERSTAMGFITSAGGASSTAMGNQTYASGDGSTAMGYETTAATDQSLSIGAYNSANTSDDNSLFVAGNGSSDNNPSDAMVLKKSGDLAVGPSDPSVRFEVTKEKSNEGVANDPTGNIALIKNTHRGKNTDVLGLQAGRRNPGSGTTYLSFYQRNGTSVGAIEGNGSGGVTYAGDGADFAEELPVAEKAEAPEPAEIVGVRGGTVSLRAEGADRVMIASTAPIMTGNAAPSSGPDAEEGRRVEVAFVGQVPAKVRGSVDRGDLIVPSGRGDGTARAVSPGEYRRAEHGPVAGQAWSSKSAEGIGEVTVAVGLGRSGAVAERLEAQQSQIDSLEEKVRQIATMKDRLAALEAEASAVPATAGPMGSPAGSWGLALLLGLGGLAGGVLWRRRS